MSHMHRKPKQTQRKDANYTQKRPSWEEPRTFCCEASALTTALPYFSCAEDLTDVTSKTRTSHDHHTLGKNTGKKRALCCALWTGRRQVLEHFKGWEQ